MTAKRLIRIAIWFFGVVLAAASALLLWLTFPGTPGGASTLKFEGLITLPKGKGARILTVLDYLTIDGRNLFVSNVSTGAIYKIPLGGTALPATSDVSLFELEPAAHGIAIDPVSRMGYATHSEANTVDVFDPSNMQLIKRIAIGDDPDAIFYLPGLKLIYAVSGDAKLATLIDPAGQSVVGTIPLVGNRNSRRSISAPGSSIKTCGTPANSPWSMWRAARSKAAGPCKAAKGRRALCWTNKRPALHRLLGKFQARGVRPRNAPCHENACDRKGARFRRLRRKAWPRLCNRRRRDIVGGTSAGGRQPNACRHDHVAHRRAHAGSRSADTSGLCRLCEPFPRRGSRCSRRFLRRRDDEGGYCTPAFIVMLRVCPFTVTVQVSPGLCASAGMHSGFGIPGGAVS